MGKRRVEALGEGKTKGSTYVVKRGKGFWLKKKGGKPEGKDKEFRRCWGKSGEAILNGGGTESCPTRGLFAGHVEKTQGV